MGLLLLNNLKCPSKLTKKGRLGLVTLGSRCPYPSLSTLDFRMGLDTLKNNCPQLIPPRCQCHQVTESGEMPYREEIC